VQLLQPTTLTAQTELDQRVAQLTALLEQVESNASDRLLAQTSIIEQKDTELVNMQVKLDELLLSRAQHVRALEQAQGALQIATSRAADADERNQRACDQIRTELAEVRAKLEARESELEAVR
jgi:chromosome segregation ATPase